MLNCRKQIALKLTPLGILRWDEFYMAPSATTIEYEFRLQHLPVARIRKANEHEARKANALRGASTVVVR